MLTLNAFELGVITGVAGTYATIRFLPVIVQDIKDLAVKAYGYVRAKV